MITSRIPNIDPNIPGQKLVYLITGPAGHYIGIVFGKNQTVTGRWHQHCSSLRFTAPRLECAIATFGKQAFTISIIANAATPVELKLKEQFFIRLYSSIQRGYNVSRGGQVFDSATHAAALRGNQNCQGKHWSVPNGRPDVAAKNRNPEFISHISAVRLGNPTPWFSTPKAKANHAASYTVERRAALALACRNRFTGKPKSESQRAKIRALWQAGAYSKTS